MNPTWSNEHTYLRQVNRKRAGINCKELNELSKLWKQKRVCELCDEEAP